ncbi:pseudaminic acid cytidylyltransferase, partial [bacterium]|nr:pseudaminic acid cytidylyltransferase [bacterium]
MSNVAIIPARGGSKRIPRKNIKEFCGKPMIAWSIEAAKEAGCFDRIIVSTDDNEVKKVALAHGAEVPFERPSDLANDHAATLPAIRHAIEWLESSGYELEAACCLYATAPFLEASLLRQAYRKLMDEGLDFVFPATNFEFPIYRAIKTDQDGKVEMI